jgi:uncharacterized membrane protein
MAHSERDYGFERLIFFSDAVFAIAITLLVLDVKLPHESLPFDVAIMATLGKLQAFALSFLVIGIYWVNHHRLFQSVTASSAALLRVNLLMLLMVSFLPFPTTIIAEYKPAPGPVIFYALSVAGLGVMYFLVAWTALRPPLMRESVTEVDRHILLARAASGPLVFIGSAIVAVNAPRAAMYSWLLIPVILWFANRVPRWWHGRSRDT